MVVSLELRWTAVFFATLALLAASARRDGAIDRVQTVDGLSIYLGVVTAMLEHGHAQDHPEARMDGGAPGKSINDMLLVIPIYDKSTGARVTHAFLTAQIPGTEESNGPFLGNL